MTNTTEFAISVIGDVGGSAIKESLVQMLNQRAKGVEKYGQPIEAAQLSVPQLLQHAQEEMADGAVYLAQLRWQYAATLEGMGRGIATTLLTQIAEVVSTMPQNALAIDLLNSMADNMQIERVAMHANHGPETITPITMSESEKPVDGTVLLDEIVAAVSELPGNSDTIDALQKIAQDHDMIFPGFARNPRNETVYPMYVKDSEFKLYQRDNGMRKITLYWAGAKLVTPNDYSKVDLVLPE